MGQDALSNLGAFALQACAIVAAAALLLRLLRLSSPGPRYVCWRLILAACLLMPWLLREPATGVSVPETPVNDGVPLLALSADPVAPIPDPPADSQPASLPWGQIVPAVILAGALVRGAWLAIGWTRLSRLRRRSVPADDRDYRDIQETLGTRARLRTVDGLTQPATFGLFRPVVLLPATLAAGPPVLRRAVVTHELFHVQRRDWLWVLAEEALRTVLWFHPAILWVTSRIQLAREEVVDELTVLATGNRRAYIEALFAFADAEPVHPAPAFARRRHLFTRIVGLSKETVMSSPRVVSSMATVIAAILICGWSASRAFPVIAAAAAAPATDILLEPAANPAPAAPRADAAPAQGARGIGAARPGPAPVPRPVPQAVPSGHPVTPENPIPRRVYAVPVPYPEELQGSGYNAAVEVSVLVDASGVPTVLSTRSSYALSQPSPGWLAARTGIAAGAAPPTVDAGRTQIQAMVTQQQSARDAFMKTVADSIRQWRYESPVDAPLEFSVSVLFGPDANGAVTQSAEPRGVSTVGGAVAVGSRGVGVNAVDPAGRQANSQLAELDRQQLELAKKRGDLVVRLGAQHPDVLALDAQRQALAARRAALVAELQARAAAQANASSAPGPVRVGGNVRPPMQTKRVAPIYPEVAKVARVQGVVIIELTLDETGHASDARILRSIPLLDQAALDAVRQWEYTPTLLNGVPVSIVMTVTVQFTLPEPQAF
jgi:protein TonB